MSMQKTSRVTIACFMILQIVLILLFELLTTYGDDANPKTPSKQAKNDSMKDTYPLFQDIHVMIFVGFGFLMTFLKKYGYSSLGFTMLIAAFVIQWALLCHGFFHLEKKQVLIDLKSLIVADETAAAILISFGAVLGEVSPLQLLFMSIIETLLLAVNQYIGTDVWKAVDAGSSMYVHVFGAYFGLAVSFVISIRTKLTKKEEDLKESNYNSDITSMIGTMFLWLFWPSFNSAGLQDGDRHRAIINTYLALASSCVVTFCCSASTTKDNKFEMEYIQNASLAGGVCIGAAANMLVYPYGALIIGLVAGFLSTLGFRYVQEFFHNNLSIHDTCGVHNLHGMPGIAAGFISAIVAAVAKEKDYGYGLYETFPARAPEKGTSLFIAISAVNPNILPGVDRGAVAQGVFQLLALLSSFIISIAGGLITGLCIRWIGKIDEGEKFDDDVFWKLPEEPHESQILIPLPGSTEPPRTFTNVFR